MISAKANRHNWQSECPPSRHSAIVPGKLEVLVAAYFYLATIYPQGGSFKKGGISGWGAEN